MAATASGLRLALDAPTAFEAAAGFPVVACFRNAGAAAIRLLDRFEPLPVFFAFSMIGADGVALDIAGAGKIDFAPGPLPTLELPPGAEHRVALQLRRWLHSPVAAGRYRLAASYYNQYGDGCFQGWLDAAPIDVQVATAWSGGER